LTSDDDRWGVPDLAAARRAFELQLLAERYRRIFFARLPHGPMCRCRECLGWGIDEASPTPKG
jgi:hypothetical protein